MRLSNGLLFFREYIPVLEIYTRLLRARETSTKQHFFPIKHCNISSDDKLIGRYNFSISIILRRRPIRSRLGKCWTLFVVVMKLPIAKCKKTKSSRGSTMLHCVCEVISSRSSHRDDRLQETFVNSKINNNRFEPFEYI